MGLKVAINGFGRMGRLTLRAAIERGSNLEFIAVNRGGAKSLAHLLKYDSVHGKAPFEVRYDGECIYAGDQKILAIYESDPSKLPWKDLNVFLVIESSGIFKDRESVSKHLESGAEKVLISAPAKKPDITVVRGVNESQYRHEEHQIVSNASCTTNCVAPIAKILDVHLGIRQGLMSTTHAYTTSQNLLDKRHKDLRRARAAAVNIIPTTTGAAEATGKVIPQLNGKLDGLAFRVPVTNVSVVDLVVNLEKTAGANDVNQLMIEASKGELKNIIGYTEEPLVSSDFIHDPRSGIIDGLSTMSMGDLVKVIAWYDNEWGYCNRMVEMAEDMVNLATSTT